jgi:hypothetical protein
MNRSFSKIRHIQEANQRLEKRLMSEQTKSEDPDLLELRNLLNGKIVQLFADSTKLHWPTDKTEKEVPLFKVRIRTVHENDENKGIDFTVDDMRLEDAYGQPKDKTLDTDTKDVYLGPLRGLTMRCGSNGVFESGQFDNNKNETERVPFSIGIELEDGKNTYQHIWPISRNLAGEINNSNFCKNKKVNTTPDYQP